MDLPTLLSHMLSFTIALLGYTATAVQYFSLCAAVAFSMPVVLLLVYDLALYTSHVLHVRQYAAALVAKMHTLKVQQISTSTRLGMRLKSLGKKQLYNQKVIYETVST